MNDLPLVSICIITYNSADFVLETLDSAKDQSYSNIELIISDDASSDSTVEVCKKWLAQNANIFERTQLITVKQNTGIPANCNRAVNASDGKWIKLIAGDDILLKDCIKDNIEHVNSNPGTELLLSVMRPFMDENGQRMFFNPVQLSEVFLNLNADQQFIEIIFGKMEGVTPTAFIARQLFDKLGFYDEEYKLAEDYPFWLKYTASQNRFVSMDRLTVLYRYHSNNTGVGKLVNGTMYKDRIKILRKYLKRLNADKSSRSEFANYYKANFFSFIKFCSKTENLELLKNVRKTKEISAFYYYLVKNYLLTFPKNDLMSKMLRSFSYRLLMYYAEP